MCRQDSNFFDLQAKKKNYWKVKKLDYKNLESELFFYISGGGQAQASCYQSNIRNISSFKFKGFFILSKEELRRNFKLLVFFLCEHALSYASKLNTYHKLAATKSLVESLNFTPYNKKRVGSPWGLTQAGQEDHLINLSDDYDKLPSYETLPNHLKKKYNANLLNRYNSAVYHLWTRDLKDKDIFELMAEDLYPDISFYITKYFSKREKLQERKKHVKIPVMDGKKVLFVIDSSLDTSGSVHSLVDSFFKEEQETSRPLSVHYSSDYASIRKSLYDTALADHSMQESVSCVVFIGKLSNNPRNVSTIRCLYRLTTCPVFVLSDVALKGLQSRFFFFNSLNENSDYSTFFEGASVAVKVLLKMYSSIYFFYKK